MRKWTKSIRGGVFRAKVQTRRLLNHSPLKRDKARACGGWHWAEVRMKEGGTAKGPPHDQLATMLGKVIPVPQEEQ